MGVKLGLSLRFMESLTVVTDLPVDDAIYRPMFCIKVVTIMLSTVHEGWYGSCVYRVYSLVSWSWDEVSTTDPTVTALKWERRVFCIRSDVWAGLETHCLHNIGSALLVQYHDLWRMHFQLCFKTKLESTYSVSLVVSLSETKIACSTNLVLIKLGTVDRHWIVLSCYDFDLVKC